MNRTCGVVVVGESAFTPSWTVGKEPGVNGSAPSTMIAPAGADVFTHGGAEEVVVVEETLLEDELELEMVVGAEEEAEVVEGAALLTVLEVLVGVGVGVVELEDVEVVEAAVLMQEQPLDIFEAIPEQADAQVGSATEVVARVYVEQNGAATADDASKALCSSSAFTPCLCS
jgi:hypothetical protein